MEPRGGKMDKRELMKKKTDSDISGETKLNDAYQPKRVASGDAYRAGIEGMNRELRKYFEKTRN